MSRPQSLPPESTSPIGESADLGFTLPSRYYLDSEIYEQEKEAIFYRNWHYVCHATAVAHPGDYVTTRIVDESLFVIRGEDGELRAFYNVCRHRAHQLLAGTGNTKGIVCPYHAWTYSLSGELRHARNSENVSGFNRTEFCLPPVQVEIFLGLVFINLDPDAESLAKLVPDLEQDIRLRIPDLDSLTVKAPAEFGGTKINAGWKVVADNYIECYHCTPAHPDFASIINMGGYQHEIFDG